MWRATFKSLLAKKLRLVLTALSVVLGVGFVAGTYVLTDTMNAAFEELFAQSATASDVIVRSTTEFDPEQAGPGGGGGEERTPLPDSLLGEIESVAGARALVSRPDIVFADEPTGNLDSRSGAELLGFLRDAVSSYGQTILMVTHDANAASYADRVVFLADGNVVDEMREPTAEGVLDRLKSLEA